MTVDEGSVVEVEVPAVPEEGWSVDRAAELYNVAGWSNDYFSVNERGHVAVHPGGSGTHAIDLKELVDEVVERGIAPPLLFRFSEILEARVVELNEAFQAAMAEYGYRGSYRGVYPIKVNQDRYMVERLVAYGRPYHFGLEAGSKPELLAVMALMEDPEALIVCNGYKDAEYIETALLASRLGRRVVLVVEKSSELPLIAELSRRTGIAPRIGIRSRLATRGAGHWEGSGGDRSKFGLSSSDLVAAVRYLREHDLLDRFQLLHFHLGSQISSIRSIKEGVREAAWTYVNLVEMGAGLRYLDVGGGLGVDYQGTRSDLVSSVNYTLREYVNDVVYGVQEVCDQREVEHPVLVSESGRATVAHHAALVVDVLGLVELSSRRAPEGLPEDASPPLVNLLDALSEVREENLLEVYHDAVAARDDARTLFKHGHVTLEERGLAEDLFWAVCRKVHGLAQDRDRRLEEVPEELRDLATRCSPTPTSATSPSSSRSRTSGPSTSSSRMLPIHRLDEEPTRLAVLADITCDSDGKIDRFIDRATSRTSSSSTPSPASPTTWAPSWWGPTRRSWATSTTCSATPTPSTSPSTPAPAPAATASTRWWRGTR
jgi:arginine decarboxylase